MATSRDVKQTALEMWLQGTQERVVSVVESVVGSPRRRLQGVQRSPGEDAFVYDGGPVLRSVAEEERAKRRREPVSTGDTPETRVPRLGGPVEEARPRDAQQQPPPAQRQLFEAPLEAGVVGAAEPGSSAVLGASELVSSAVGDAGLLKAMRTTSGRYRILHTGDGVTTWPMEIKREAVWRFLTNPGITYKEVCEGRWLQAWPFIIENSNETIPMETLKRWVTKYREWVRSSVRRYAGSYNGASDRDRELAGAAGSPIGKMITKGKSEKYVEETWEGLKAAVLEAHERRGQLLTAGDGYAVADAFFQGNPHLKVPDTSILFLVRAFQPGTFDGVFSFIRPVSRDVNAWAGYWGVRAEDVYTSDEFHIRELRYTSTIVYNSTGTDRHHYLAHPTHVKRQGEDVILDADIPASSSSVTFLPVATMLSPLATVHRWASFDDHCARRGVKGLFVVEGARYNDGVAGALAWLYGKSCQRVFGAARGPSVGELTLWELGSSYIVQIPELATQRVQPADREIMAAVQRAVRLAWWQWAGKAHGEKPPRYIGSRDNPKKAPDDPALIRSWLLAAFESIHPAALTESFRLSGIAQPGMIPQDPQWPWEALGTDCDKRMATPEVHAQRGGGASGDVGGSLLDKVPWNTNKW